MLADLAEQLDAAPIQHIGKLLVLWRPIPPKEKAERDDRMAGPRTVKIVSFSKSGNHRATVKKVQVFGNQRVTAGGEIKRVKTRAHQRQEEAGGLSAGAGGAPGQRQHQRQLDDVERRAHRVQLAEAERALPGPRRGHHRLHARSSRPRCRRWRPAPAPCPG